MTKVSEKFYESDIPKIMSFLERIAISLEKIVEIEKEPKSYREGWLHPIFGRNITKEGSDEKL